MMMDKAPDAYRTISEVAEDLDLPQHVLRFWETRFGQIKPLKRGGGRRYYRPDDVELLKGIRHLLYKEGYTIKGVQRILKEQGVKAVQAFVRESLSVEVPAMAPAAPARTPEPFRPTLTSEAPPRAFAEPVQAPLSPGPVILHEPDMEDVDDEAGDEAPDDFEPALAPMIEPAASAQENPAARGQVSMFRGGLQRDAAAPSAPLAEFATQIRERVEHHPPRPDAPSLGVRDALMMALDELVACRAAIDQVLARRQA